MPPSERTALTTRQHEVLSAIDAYTLMHGYAPSVRELGLAIGVGSTNGVVCHLKALQRKGFITWNPMQARTIRVIKKG
jgi:repressor LexA